MNRFRTLVTIRRAQAGLPCSSKDLAEAGDAILDLLVAVMPFDRVFDPENEPHHSPEMSDGFPLMSSQSSDLNVGDFRRLRAALKRVNGDATGS